MTMLMLILSFIYIVSLSIAFFRKKHIESKELSVFSLLVKLNVSGLLLEIIMKLGCWYLTTENTFVQILLRVYLIYIIWFSIIMVYYVLLTCTDKEDKINNNSPLIYIGLTVGIIMSIISVFLPVEFAGLTTDYCVGLAVNVIFAFCGVLLAISFALMVKNYRVLKTKKAIPLIVFFVGMVLGAIIQKIRPEITITTIVEAYVLFLMYFTIENPDIRLVEYEKREKELAQSANEAKTAFLSSMSHEIRTPLNAIVGLSEDIMSYQDKVPEEVKEDSIDIVNASNTLLEIIGNILDISKIEGGKLELIESDYLPKEEIESLLKIMRTKLDEKDLEFNVYIDPNIPECLYGDRLRIKQIINNFLSNAIKYTEKGSVNFGVRWINNSLEIRVKDTGRGIKKEDMDKLFQKFERLQVEKNSSVQGTGLGLAITKNLIDLMGGSVKVESEEGKGSMFAVIIPQKLGNKDNIVREALSVEERHEVDYSGKKLLVVDDNKLNIKVLRKAIAAFNFEIDECYDGATAIDKINANNYDIILMDIMMPGMGGEEAIGILKQNPDFKIPVIALTADATNGAKERYLACGFVDYLAKPFSRDVIAKKLENILGNTK